MHYRTLGRTGIQVSPYCLGAMMFGAIGNPDHDDCVRIVHKALDAGINFVDTADMYSRGESEEIVGKALKGRRDDVVLATKVWGPMGDDPNRRGNSRRWIITEVENSLRRLGTDHIDLYQVHRPDPTVDVEETLSALTDLVRGGKVRAIGSSCFPASDIVEAQWAAERRGLERFRTEQPAYSILDRGIEREILPVTERHGMGTLVWSPLAQGMLTGRFRKGRPADTHRAGYGFRHYRDERRLDVVERLIPLAERAGMKLTHLAMAFAVAHPGVTSAIIGPRTMEQLDDLLAGAGVALGDEILDEIDAIVAPGTDVGRLDSAYDPPALERAALRRRPAGERA
ncbi:aldo/keto reductase, partial [Streptosporangium sp. NPDC048865]|uniref:aldo/keto reductase n=1 Tax=Streptosporangium sp. NPDC048865 TaxID=3155766 RepID=UPI0034313BDA